MDPAHVFEVAVNLGIFAVAGILATVSAVAWRRERSPKMARVALGYALFSIGGLLGATEPWLLGVVPYQAAEFVESSGGVFFLAGLLLFFWALAR